MELQSYQYAKPRTVNVKATETTFGKEHKSWRRKTAGTGSTRFSFPSRYEWANTLRTIWDEWGEDREYMKEQLADVANAKRESSGHCWVR